VALRQELNAALEALDKELNPMNPVVLLVEVVSAVRELPRGALEPGQTDEILKQAIEEMLQSPSDAPDPLVSGIKELAPNLSDEAAQRETSRVLAGIKSCEQPRDVAPLATTLSALAGKMTEPQATEATTSMQTLLAWSTDDATSGVAAEALVSLSQRRGDAKAIQLLIEALKYPSAAGNATHVLLAGLIKSEANRPSGDGLERLEDSLEWIAANAPAQAGATVDMVSSPSCPRPPWPSMRCPKGARGYSAKAQ
jgi:hypothetical protein